MGLRKFFKDLMAPTLTDELQELAFKADWTHMNWTTANKVRFEFRLEFEPRRPRYYSATVWIENPVTGESTYVWRTQYGFVVTDPTLQQWFFEGVELLKSEYQISIDKAKQEHHDKVRRLADQYPNRFSTNDSQEM